MKEDIIRSFNRIALLEDKWDHNQHYEQLLMREVNNIKGIALDIGCGTGEFTCLLSNKVEKVYGIDISPVMITEAKKRHFKENIEYVLKDFDEINDQDTYDIIVSIATFHHLNLELALPKVKRILKDGGILLVLDLYERKGVIDRILDILAVPLNLIMNRIKNKKASEDETEAWNEHSHIDHYMTFKDLKSIYRNYFSSEIIIRRLLFWRYLLIYRK